MKAVAAITSFEEEIVFFYLACSDLVTLITASVYLRLRWLT
jgi:hypothetical protein